MSQKCGGPPLAVAAPCDLLNPWQDKNDGDNKKSQCRKFPTVNKRPSKAIVKAKKAEVAARDRAKKPKFEFEHDLRALIINADVRRIIDDRYGRFEIQESAQAAADLTFIGRIYDEEYFRRLVTWRAKWFIEQMPAALAHAGFRPTPKDISEHFGLAYEKRAELGIRQIPPCGMTRDEFKKRRLKDRAKQVRDNRAKKRRAAGAKPRAAYIAESASQNQPWIALGICRRTWERRRQKAVASMDSHLYIQESQLATRELDYISDESSQPIAVPESARAA